ncbi:MAG: type II secretion system F family protein [Chitinispirillales bacterium]|jgi:type IV pilus assembly protein PilC|nr:type II secretion system F family protein [Chitinispirillales bacterium]
MPKYAYKARDDQGRMQSGTVEANSIDDCMTRLEAKALEPVSIDELSFDGTKKERSLADRANDWLLSKQNKVPYKDAVFFTRQLATLVNGGVALPRAVEQLGQNEKHTFKRILTQIGDDLATGSTFSDALAKHPQVFNHMFVSVVRAGETAGALDEVLNQLADYMENMEAMKAKVKAAMRYPTVIAGFVTIVITLVLIFLVPVFKDMYAGFGATLPAPTLIMIAMSDAIRYNAVIVVLTILGLGIGLTALFVMVDKAKYLFHRYVLEVPVFGIILRKNILAIYCRTMSLLMNSGTPILEATQIGGAAVANKFYAEVLERVYNDLKNGELLSAALVKNKREFPPLVTQLVATGEESGKVDDLMRKASEFYDREIRNTVDSIASIIEPFLIVILGAIVGGMLIALYLPVFTIGQAIGGA